MNKAEQREHTSLWIASLRGHYDVVDSLLCEPNIDVNHKDLSGVSALWVASQNGHHKIVELLLQSRNIGKMNERKGADPNLAKNDG